MIREGKIVKIVSNDYTVSSDKIYLCKCRGKFRLEKLRSNKKIKGSED